MTAWNAKVNAAILVCAQLCFLVINRAKKMLTVSKLQSLTFCEELRMDAAALVIAPKLLFVKPRKMTEIIVIPMMNALLKAAISFLINVKGISRQVANR